MNPLKYTSWSVCLDLAARPVPVRRLCPEMMYYPVRPFHFWSGNRAAFPLSARRGEWSGDTKKGLNAVEWLAGAGEAPHPTIPSMSYVRIPTVPRDSTIASSMIVQDYISKRFRGEKQISRK